jgi:hypothetical protein
VPIAQHIVQHTAGQAAVSGMKRVCACLGIFDEHPFICRPMDRQPGPMDRRALGIRYDHALRGHAGGGREKPPKALPNPKALGFWPKRRSTRGAQLGSG